MRELLGNSDTEGLLAMEHRQGKPLRALKTTSDDEDDAAFKTCMSGGTEDAFGSQTSSRRKIFKRLNLDAFYNGAQFRAGGETTERTGGRSERRKNVRGLLNMIYGEQEMGALQQRHRRPMDSDINSATTNTVDAAAPVVAVSPGTPLKKRKEKHEAGEWVSARHTALEELRLELDKRLRTDAHFRPELREVAKEKEEHIEQAIEEEEEEEGHQRNVSVMTGERRRFSDSIDSSRGLEMSPAVISDRAEPGRMNESAIDLSDIHDIPDGRSMEVMRRAEERSIERKQRAETEFRNRELLECTFHPQVAPNSAVLFQKMALGKGNVFGRLYPQELRDQAAKARDAQMREELESLERYEIEFLRERCGGLTAACPAEDNFGLFLSNVLGRSVVHGAVSIKTDYKSPLAQKMHADASIGDSDGSGMVKKTTREERRYRIACFDEFLQRQNEHKRSRSRSVRNMEKALTPSFKPEISVHSVQIAKELMARSSTTPSGSNNASALASAVKKHRSPYVDPCTFKPRITAVSRAMEPRGVESMANDGVRLREWRKRQQERAAKEEIKYPFRPTLNDAHNKRIESLLTLKNYSRYEQGLRRRKEQMARMKEEQDAIKENEEVERSTFCPKTTRKPEYVTRMASSFALVRQQYGEL
ncbi:hypothetical protein C3747_55g36 [Trypanosoma cruzi]|uniref:Uncharacterized protein n=2 Tax=Trypanosoma cruzi TaxID=5693 RepID=Q4D8M7_TRYCC|nr:hypothetical protein, conserved [Trypanosoma cruzi]EAN88881.1 hypothetical protein, conserved [Trypanosoma cruzi]KAF5223142.1 hypothetical protein ECC02_003681 [Trypanosoma cruzi]PWV11904.1 hypothetical protein C3747_55g36 [Trypanosoma cruzi]RNC60477.1 hypothetical protein TcCL_ESM01822 [Trypanosoma cruzi]|eukprot:XP_810732.1 hypothetical protein [Trypanosoma cruzi strain CL Brener]